MDLVCCHFIWLNIGWSCNNPDRQANHQSCGDGLTGTAAGFVAVEHQNDFSKVSLKKVFLALREGRPHEGDNAWKSGLVHFDAVKEPFDYYNRPTVTYRTVKIEKHQRLAKTRRKPVLGFSAAREPSRVRRQGSLLSVNGDHNTTFHTVLSGIEAHAEMEGGIEVHAALDEIGMMRVKAS